MALPKKKKTKKKYLCVFVRCMAPTSGPKPIKTSLALSDDGMSVEATLTEEK